jgi:hypothetical protein
MIRHAGNLAIAVGLAITLAAPARADLSSRLGALEGSNLKGYLAPLPDAMSSTLNSSLFQSGRISKGSPHVSVGIHVGGASFEDADRTFTPTDPFGFQPNTPTDVPTIVGDGNAVAVPDNGGQNPVYPGGLDISQFLLPVPQLTVGDVLGTRATVRWLSLDTDNSDLGKFEFFGIGAQHSVSQYLPGLPVDVAAGVFYQKLKLGDGLLDTHSMHFDVTASKHFGGLLQLEPYVSVGYDTFDMKVKYTFTGSGAPSGGEELTVDFDTVSNKHLAAGAQLTLAIVKLHAEVFSAALNGAAIGLSIGR